MTTFLSNLWQWIVVAGLSYLAGGAIVRLGLVLAITLSKLVAFGLLAAAAIVLFACVCVRVGADHPREWLQ